MKIWRLESNPDKWLSIQASSITYFSNHFIGKKMPDEWSPPAYEILGKSKKIPDYISWVIGAPLIVERFANAIQHWEGSYIQLLPFGQIKNKRIFALNVIKVINNIVDMDRSEISYLGPDRIFSGIKKTVFKNFPSELPPIFKLEKEISREIYVSEEFCKLVVDHQFTGLCLADPAIDSFKLIIRGLDRNVYPGVPG